MNKCNLRAEDNSKKEMRILKISTKEYDALVKQASPNSKSYKNLPMAFLIGGLICTIGELLRQWFTAVGMDKTEAGAWVSVILVLVTAILTGIGWFDKIAKVAGAGTFVPITGFANSVVSPAIEFKTEGMVLGLGAKMFVIAGPVIVYGTIASVIFGVIYYIIQLFV